MRDFGTITFNGQVFTLTQEAYADNFGTDGGVRYYAGAVDTDGNEHQVTWGLKISIEDYKNLEDESNACDWDNPISVE